MVLIGEPGNDCIAQYQSIEIVGYIILQDNVAISSHGYPLNLSDYHSL
jgi:hypothetical protein